MHFENQFLILISVALELHLPFLIKHNYIRIRIVVFGILFLLNFLAIAQKQSFKFSTISTEKGLSHSNVTAIVQDKNGFMWFGTKEGLNKYDGYTFTVYKNDPDNVYSLSNNFI